MSHVVCLLADARRALGNDPGHRSRASAQELAARARLRDPLRAQIASAISLTSTLGPSAQLSCPEVRRSQRTTTVRCRGPGLLWLASLAPVLPPTPKPPKPRRALWADSERAASIAVEVQARLALWLRQLADTRRVRRWLLTLCPSPEGCKGEGSEEESDMVVH